MVSRHDPETRAALLGRQVRPRPAQPLGLVDRELALARVRVRAGEPQREERLRGHRLGAPQPDGVDRQVAGDRQQPGRHRAAPGVIGRRVPPCPHEGLLGDVLGPARVAHDRQRQAVDAPLEAADERGRGGPVARGQARQERIVGDG